jgi:hypothetical protein
VRDESGLDLSNYQSMKTGAITLALVAALGVGVLIGRHLSPAVRGDSPPSSTNAERTATPDVAPPAFPASPAGTQPSAPADFKTEYNRILTQLRPWQHGPALYRLGEAAALSAIPQYLAFLTPRHEPEALTLAEVLVRRWAQADPAAAVAYAKGLPRLATREALVRCALEEWIQAAPAAALKWVEALPAGREKEKCWSTAFDALASRDPKQALALADGLTVSAATKNRLRGVILQSWARTDPPAAAAVAAAMKDTAGSLLGDIASRWAIMDPKTAMAWVAGLPSLKARQDALWRAAEGWASVDGQAAVTYLLSQPAGETHTALSSALKRWAADEPEAAMSWAAGLPNDANRTPILCWLADACAAIDPAIVTPYLRDLPAKLQGDLAMQVVDTLLKENPSAGLDFVKSLPEGEIQRNATLRLFKEWAPLDLAGAMACLDQLPEGTTRDGALGGLLRQWVKQDVNAAMAYVQALPTDKQDTFLGDAVRYWASADPAAASQWVAALPQGDARNQRITQVASVWALSSLTDAGNFLLTSLAPGDAQNSAVETVVSSAQITNPQGVRQWVSGFPPGELRDHVVAITIQGWGESDVAGAAAWLDANFNGAYAENEEEVARSWLIMDQPAARKWIQGSALPDDAKRRLLGP